MHTLADLEAASLADLERLYVEAPLDAPPTGCLRGEFLTYVDSPGAKKALVRAGDTLLFRLPRFGVDFEHCAWWFFSPALRAGRFTLGRRASRWRDTETFALEYGVSRLPSGIKGLLYDEVKPLGPDLYLGFGGMNAEVGSGDHFFFALTRPPT